MTVGYFFSAATTAFIRKASGDTLTPALAFSSLTRARKVSSSVMSASSNCVTCGIITQLRASPGAEIFWMRVRASVSIGPNLAKSTLGQGGRPRSASPPPRALAPPVGQRLLHEGLDVLLEDAALRPRARDLGERHAQLTREPAHAGARVGEGTCRRLR